MLHLHQEIAFMLLRFRGILSRKIKLHRPRKSLLFVVLKMFKSKSFKQNQMFWHHFVFPNCFFLFLLFFVNFCLLLVTLFITCKLVIKFKTLDHCVEFLWERRTCNFKLVWKKKNFSADIFLLTRKNWFDY